MKCKNCGSLLNGKFCKDCGQNSNVDRINLSNFLSELSESVFQVNKGLFFTIKELFKRPGYAIADFLNGKRKNYFKPIAYVLTLSTVYFLVSQLSDSQTIIDNFFSGFDNAKNSNESLTSKSKSSEIAKWLSNNYAYAILFLLPVFSLATFISFIGTGKNYLEHIVINSYITGQQAIIYSLFLVFGVLFQQENTFVSISIMISTVFNFWVFCKLFSNKKAIAVILRLILAYGFYYFLFQFSLLYF